MCQRTEGRGRILRVCETAEANLTQAFVDDKQLIPSCLAASVRHLFMVSPALGSCQQPPDFSLVFVKTLSLCTYRFLTAAFTCWQMSLCRVPPGNTGAVAVLKSAR